MMCFGCARDFGPKGELVHESEKLLLHEVLLHGNRYRFCSLACIGFAESNGDINREVTVEIRTRLEPRALEKPGDRPQWRGGRR